MEKDNRPEQIYMDKHEICLAKNSDGQYFPFTYKNKNGEWIVPLKGDIIFDWITYIKRTVGSEVNPITREKVDGNLNPMQWGISINIINSLIEYKTDIYSLMASRQTGKTFVLEHIQSFMTVFGRRYKTQLKGNKWTTISMSHKKESVTKNFLGIRKGIKRAVEVYNDLYGNSNHWVVYGNYNLESGDKKTTTDKDDLLRLDCIIGANLSVEWGECYALTAQTDSDGLTSCLTCADESTLIDAKQFFRSILPFSSANGGSVICTGITCTDPSKLQYAIYENKDSIKISYSWLDYYRILKITDKKQADIYKESIETQIQACGGHESTEALTNYYMSWDITLNKFTNRTQLQRNQVYETIIGDINYNADYIVGGLDLSIANDYTVLTVAESYNHTYSLARYGSSNFEEDFKHYIKEIITYNLDRQRMDAVVLAKKIALDCKKYRIGILTIDSTGTQLSQVQLIYDEIVRLGINTLVVPFNFSGSSNKLMMMGYLESVLFSGRCKLPLEEYKKSHKSYEIFLDEILSLMKIKEEGKQNVQFRAPKSKTDDHVFSFALCVYTMRNIIKMRADNKLIEIGTKKIIPRLNKFKLLSEIEQPVDEMETYITGLF